MTSKLAQSIIPMSELRANPDKVKKQAKKSPVIITNKGRPDFGICDLETLEIARHITSLRDLLTKRIKNKNNSVDADKVFSDLEEKYNLK